MLGCRVSLDELVLMECVWMQFKNILLRKYLTFWPAMWYSPFFSA